MPPSRATRTLMTSGVTPDSPEEYLAICAATKEVGAEVREWAEYHLRAGAARIYLFDTDNPEPSEGDLADLINAGKVEYYYLPRVSPATVPLMQVQLYQLCLYHTRERHAFLAFIDVDEFLVLAPSERAGGLAGLLQRYEDQVALAVNWRLLGSSGHSTQPEGGILRNFLACTPVQYHENRQVKSIVNTQFVTGVTSDPHHFQYEGGRVAVTTGGQPVDSAMAPGVWGDKLMLYHYATKSHAHYRGKMLKGESCSAMGNRKGLDFLDRIDSVSTEVCSEALSACIELGVPTCAGATIPEKLLEA